MKWILTILFLANFSLSFAPKTDFHIPGPEEIKMVKFRAFLFENPKPDFTQETFFLFLKHAGVKCPDIVLSQAVLESGWFKSLLFVQYNNPFGMGCPRIRETTCIDSYKGFAVYEHWTDAVYDLKLWQQYRSNLDQSDYFQFLVDSNYAEDPNYVKKLRKIRSKMEKVISSSEVEVMVATPEHKFHVTQPELDMMDIIRVKVYAEAKGLECIIEGKKALIIKDNVPGFVQKQRNILLAVFKDGTFDNISKYSTVASVLQQFNVFDIDNSPGFNPEGFFAMTRNLRSRC